MKNLDVLKTMVPPTFSAVPFYNRKGDSVDFFFQNEAFEAERVDGFLTIYKSIATGAITGISLKGVRSLIVGFLDGLTATMDNSSERKVVVRLRDVLGLALGKCAPPPEKMRIYLDLLATNLNELVPEEAIRRAA